MKHSTVNSDGFPEEEIKELASLVENAGAKAVATDGREFRVARAYLSRYTPSSAASEQEPADGA